MCLLRLSAVFFLLSLAGATRWTPETYPNPQQDVWKCGRKGVSSWVCDPDGVITYESANVVEGILKKVYAGQPPYALGVCGQVGLQGYQVAVALMRRMDYVGDAGVAAGQFARSLHDRWGVGNPHCNNGVVLLLSIEDRQIFISAGSGTTSLLTYDVLGDIVNDVRPSLKDQRYNDAAERAVVDIGLALAGRPVEPEGGSASAGGGEWLGLGIFAAAVGGLMYFGARTETLKRRRYEDCKAKLEKLKRDQAAMRASTYNPTSCPVCLEDFTESAAGGPGSVSPSRTEGTAGAAAEGAVGAAAAAGGVQMGGRCTSCAHGDDDAAKAPTAAPAPSGGGRKEVEEEEQRKPLLGDASGGSGLGGAASYPGGAAPSAPPLPTPAGQPTPPPAGQQQRRPLVLPCGHAFCEPCITQWLEQKKVTCPICRKPFDEDDSSTATDPRDTNLPRPPPPRPDTNTRNDRAPGSGAGPSSYTAAGPRPPCIVDDEWYDEPSVYGSGTMYGGGAVPRLRLRWGSRRRPPIRMQEELLLAEMMFRLRQLQRQHPDYISAGMLHAWEQDLQHGREFSAQQLRQFQLSDPATRRGLAYSGSSGTGVHFGGGSSQGGGGRGGSW